MEFVTGRIARAHGVRGELAVDVRTDEPEQRFAVGTVLRGRRRGEHELSEFRVEAAREHGARLLVRLAGIGDRAAADALRGTVFVVRDDELPPSGEDAFYDHELIGLAVTDGSGAAVGSVRDVVHGDAGEWLAVRPSGSEAGEILIPFVAAIVTSVDVVGGTVVIDPPPGLLES